MSRIMILEGHSHIGGGQMMTIRINSILNKEHEVYNYYPKNAKLRGYLNKDNSIEYKMKSYTKGKKIILDYFKFILNTLYIIPHLSTSIKRLKIDIIYVQSQNMIPYASIVGKLLNKPVIVHLHVVHLDNVTNKFMNYFLKFSSVKKVIGVSDYTLKSLNKENYLKSCKIYNYIDFIENSWDELEFEFNKTDFKIAIIGEVLKSKGQDILLKSTKYLKLNKYKLYIIGQVSDNEYMKELENIVEELNIKENVIFTGRVENIEKVLNNIDLVIVASRSFETFSLAMVEAWMKGIPTIASNIGGPNELVCNFLSYYNDKVLFENKNHKDLANKINKIALDNELYKNISKDVRKVAEREFSYSTFKKEIETVVNSVTC